MFAKCSALRPALSLHGKGVVRLTRSTHITSGFQISRGSLRQNIIKGITGAVGTLTRVSFRKYQKGGGGANRNIEKV